MENNIGHIDLSEDEMSQIIVKVKRIEDGQIPTKGTSGAAAWDLYARTDCTVIAGDRPTLVPLGFAIEIPEGYHAKVLPRSSTGLKTPLRMANSCGIIDSDYRGEVMMIAEAVREDWQIARGERVAQMLIEKNDPAVLVEVDDLSDTARGEGGFGSTGK